MNVASKDLCRELYELSGWDDNELWDCTYKNQTVNATLNRVQIASDRGDYYWTDPRYDLGYLLRKLPHVINEDEHRGDYLVLEPITATKWAASYGNRTSDEWADTPEDAACKLAIELFKQGVLK